MTPEHRDRTALLDTLALLAGFDTQIATLPDGRAPDVVRISLSRRGLFIGDAKHADSAHSAETYLRLRRYARWGDAFLTRPDRSLALALAVPRSTAGDWIRLLLTLSEDVGLPDAQPAGTLFGSTAVVQVLCHRTEHEQLGPLAASSCDSYRRA